MAEAAAAANKHADRLLLLMRAGLARRAAERALASSPEIQP
jgi:hypothetical protein